MTKSEKEKKDRKNKLIVGIVLVAVMIVSTLGYSLLSGTDNGTSSTKVTYKGIDFYKNGNLWQARINGGNFSFSYLPSDVADISVPSTINLQQFYNKPLYFDSGDQTSYYEIAGNLQDYVQGVKNACLNASDCADESFPIKTCKDNVIVIRDSNQTSIRANGNCTFISGEADMLKEGDAFLYRVLGIN